MFKFNKTYFFLTVFIFVVEIVIALYIHDKLIRPYIGDLLVVTLIYCFLKSFLNARVLPVALFVFAFACFVELLQYLNIVEVLRLNHSKVARIVIGTSFSWEDLFAYALGFGLILLLERPRFKQRFNKASR